MEKCVTIASACNRFWRKKLVPKNKLLLNPLKAGTGPDQISPLKLSNGWPGKNTSYVFNILLPATVSAPFETEAKCAWPTIWWTVSISAIPSLIVPPCTNFTDVYGMLAPAAFPFTATDFPSAIKTVLWKKSTNPPSRNKRP